MKFYLEKIKSNQAKFLLLFSIFGLGLIPSQSDASVHRIQVDSQQVGPLSSMKWAKAGRLALSLCLNHNKDFMGGYFSGFQDNATTEVVCFTPLISHGAQWEYRAPTRISGLRDLNVEEGWASARRKFAAAAHASGFKAGFPTGHFYKRSAEAVFLGNKNLDKKTVKRFNVKKTGFKDTNHVEWYVASKIATEKCYEKGYAAGFFDGHQHKGNYGLICYK
jgi:hypothetical protein